MSSLKEYVSQSVQTDLDSTCEPELEREPARANAAELSELHHEKPVLLLPAGNPGREEIRNAYMPSDDSLEVLTSDNSEVRPRRYKYSDLSHNRPSECGNLIQERRIVSLPETAPSESVKVASESARRIVSVTTVLRPVQSERLDQSGEYTQLSASTLGELDNSGDDSGTFGQYSHGCGPLKTPSPPSSPESITIIGNPDMQVPSTFLSSEKAQDSYRHLNAMQDEDGWTTWANSPPRPIPALHGPLSLPYARCPSGAEGTVIEQPAEIPRVIWGLSIDEARPCHSWTLDHDVHHGRRRTTQSTSLEHCHIRACARLNSHDAPTYPKSFHVPSQSTSGCLPSLDVNLLASHNALWNEDDADVMHLAQPLGSFQSPNFNQNGLQHLAGDPTFLGNGLRLFVPENTSAKVDDMPTNAYLDGVAHRLVQRLADPQVKTRTRDAPAGQSIGVPLSPRWTPLFSSYLDMFGSPDIALSPSPATPRLPPKPLPQVEPATVPTIDALSEELRRFVLKEMACSGNNIAVNGGSIMSEGSGQTRHSAAGLVNPRMAIAHGIYAEPAPNTPLQPRPPPNSPMSFEPSRPHWVGRASHLSPIQTTPTSPPECAQPGSQNLLSCRRPRSVPFSRLMQRGLSTVQEHSTVLSQIHKTTANNPPSRSLDESIHSSPIGWNSRSHQSTSGFRPFREPWVSHGLSRKKADTLHGDENAPNQERKKIRSRRSRPIRK